MTGGMLLLYLLLTLVMGTAIIVGIVKTQTAVVEGTVKVDKKDVKVKKTWREWAKGREEMVDQVDPARRGDILSSDGKILATTIVKCDLYLDLGKKYEIGPDGKAITGPGAKFTGTITDSLLFASLDTMAQMLSESMKLQSKDYYVNLVKEERAKDFPRQCFRIESKVPYSVWLAIYRLPGWKTCVVKEKDYRSVKYAERDHIYAEMASNTVGWQETDPNTGYGTGRYKGLEGAYDSILRGRDGVYNSRRLTKGIWLADIPDEGETVDKRTDADSVQKVVLRKRVDGQSIVAAIDTRIQDVAEDALRQKLSAFGGRAGCAIVMEVETGYVVACANLSRKVKKNGDVVYEEQRDWNSAISGRYNPGSTMKGAVMMAMLNDPKLKIDTSMQVHVGERLFPGSKKKIEDTHRKPISGSKKGRDSLSVREIIEESSNVGMSELGWMYYRDRRNDLVTLLRQVFPYEKLNLDVDVPENNYLLNDVNTSVDDFLRLTYGYSTAVSPMQIITFYNAVANGGRMVKPLFCRAVIDREGRRHEMPPVVMRERAFSRESVRILTEMLEGVVNNGTARRVVKDNNYRIAGKTGTAVKGGKNDASFAGFFPVNHPRYTCYVMLEEVDAKAFGTQAAVVFKMISDCVMAIDERLGEDLFSVDKVDSTKLNQEPVLLRGNQKEIEQVYGIIGRPYTTTDKGSKWVVYHSASKDSPSTYQPESPKQGKVPNCYGLSAKDAVELLHSLGFKVRITGYGKVASQSLRAGSEAKKGTTVVVNLK
jgi:cell division protein FtsI (penicillin-binding protein 3)